MKILKKVLRIIPIILFIIAIFLIINISISIKKGNVPKIFGYSYMVVLTGSMEPTLQVNDFIIVKSEDEYAHNDILSFYYDINGDGKEEVITHRLIEISEDKYHLKGDNDNGIQEVKSDAIVGHVIYTSSFFGQIFSLQIFRNKNFIFGSLVTLLSMFTIYQIINIIKIMKDKESEA